MNNNKWTEYSYPQSWSSDFFPDRLYTYLTEDKNNLFIKAYSTPGDYHNYQLMKINLLDLSMQTIDAEQGFLDKGIYDIKEWRNHEDCFIFLRFGAVCIYNSRSGTMETIFDDLEFATQDILQSDSGKYMYLFGKSGSSDFYILNLEAKTLEKHVYTLEEDCSFVGSGSIYYDRDKNLLLHHITKYLGMGDYEKTPVILNLDDF